MNFAVTRATLECVLDRLEKMFHRKLYNVQQ